jgi:NAD(P)-dependent dehydrogenase (short-subunit alcohol dehydrogenase family)
VSEKKVVVVTGSASGVGAATAMALARHRPDVRLETGNQSQVPESCAATGEEFW